MLRRPGYAIADVARRLAQLRPGRRGGPLRRIADRPDIASAGFARLTVLPAILAAAWLLPGLPLLLAGDFLPVPVLLSAVPAAVVLMAMGLRQVPARWPRRLPGAAGDSRWASWWGTAGTAAVAAGFATWQLLENSPSLIVTRNPGAYLQAGYWIAQHGSLPIPQSLAAFGSVPHGLAFSSTSFFAHGNSVLPAFTSGLPMIIAGGFWTNGISAAAGLSPVLGGLAILAFGGLVARLAGQQWAPAGALVLGLTLPEQYTSRSAFSETLVQILAFGGLCLLIDAMAVTRPPPAPAGAAPAGAAPAAGWRGWPARIGRAGWLAPERLLSGVGGLALGLTVLANISSVVFVLAAIPCAGALWAGRRAIAIPFCGGVAVGAGYGLADGYLLSRPFTDAVAAPLELAGITAAWLAALTLLVIQLQRATRLRALAHRRLVATVVRWLPEAGGLLVLAALIGLAVRPYLQTARGGASQAVRGLVASLQRLQHLPVDPGRLYAEDTLYWVIWYVGVPAVLLGGFGLALLVRHGLRALLTWRDPTAAWRSWGLPLLVILAGSAAVLWNPATVPDQPWASRRLVPIVIPGLILCGIWAAAWLAGRARERGAGAITSSVVGLFCVGALALPAVTTSFGLGLSHTGTAGGLQPTADGMALRPTSAGELGAVRGLCASIPRSATVIIVDQLVAQQFAQVVRGMCGVPAASMAGQAAPVVDSVLAGISRTGRRPVLLAASAAQLTALGGRPVRVLDLVTTQDPHQLTQPPASPVPARYVIWMALPSTVAAGA